MPEAGSNRARLARPPSTTMRMSGRVSEVSAMAVASTTLRAPGIGASAARCPAASIAPKSGRIAQPGRPASSASTRRISPSPGRKTRMPPSASSAACRTSAATAASKRSEGSAGRGSQRVSTGKARPSAVRTGTPPIRAATGAASSVADMTRSRRSGLSAARTSSASARPRSACSERSWNSSKITQETPGSSGSDWIIRVRMPSVTTSIRVRAEVLASPRIR